jgi:hypothetical protein
MNRLMICLGTLLLFAACSLAQTSVPQAGQPSSTPVANSSTSSGSSSQSQNQKTTSADGFDKPSGHHHVRLGGVAVSGGYSHFSGYPYAYAYDPFYYPFSPLPVAMFWNPFWGYYPPFYPTGYFGPGNGKGELKLTGAPKDASVYVNGGYAGTIEHLKSFWLDPGAYDLEVTTVDGRRFQQRVYMLTGKTLRLEAKPLEKPREGENL